MSLRNPTALVISLVAMISMVIILLLSRHTKTSDPATAYTYADYDRDRQKCERLGMKASGLIESTANSQKVAGCACWNNDVQPDTNPPMRTWFDAKDIAE